ncbi:MAG: GNAT family N-acetyltransferase [Bacteroidota bacterium]
MLTVQRGTLENVDIIALLFDAYRQFYSQPADRENARAFISERLNNEESVIFIAYWNNEAAGFTQLYPLFSSVSMRRTWVLNDLYVDANFRKKGIATGLLETAKAHGRANNAKGLMLETASDNITAQKLYEKNGWQKEENLFYEFVL